MGKKDRLEPWEEVYSHGTISKLTELSNKSLKDSNQISSTLTPPKQASSEDLQLGGWEYDVFTPTMDTAFMDTGEE